ncbi:MAG: hypothetical protein ABSA49_19655, partial [Rhizomicrobium sp.]
LPTTYCGLSSGQKAASQAGFQNRAKKFFTLMTVPVFVDIAWRPSHPLKFVDHAPLRCVVRAQ